ncbi:hypothetical protein SY94_5192 (plasmid) [Agrobacterium tumefaciens]|nr:hypothetical protein SY94_5192 [Agrobacterium tumefaciens]
MRAFPTRTCVLACWPRLKSGSAPPIHFRKFTTNSPIWLRFRSLALSEKSLENLGWPRSSMTASGLAVLIAGRDL